LNTNKISATGAGIGQLEGDSMDRKKELKTLYKQMKPEMGIFMIRSNSSNKCYLEGTQNLRAALNSARFKLEAGIHPVRELQEEWKKYGALNFTFEVLQRLEYDEDESKTDYSEELELLKIDWEERLVKEKVVLYTR